MKALKLASVLSAGMLLVSCSSHKMGGFHASKKEVDELHEHDYHANLANKIIDHNGKKKKANDKKMRDYQTEYQAYLNNLNNPNTRRVKKKPHSNNSLLNSTAFTFY